MRVGRSSLRLRDLAAGRSMPTCSGRSRSASAQVLIRGEAGQRALFVLPAVLFTVAMVIFPTFFGLYIAFTDWNLSSFEGRRFNGLDNL